MRAIYGKKLMMTRLFDEKGSAVPVTLVEVVPNTVSRLKTADKDGYVAVEVAAGTKKRLNKPEQGKFGALNIKPKKLFEVRTDQEFKVGDQITLDLLKEGETVNVTAISKGKGFQGTVKRHHFNTGPRTHGSNNYRQPGSIGAQQPQRVVLGRKMAGHLGADQVTTQNLVIYKIDQQKNLLFLRGAVPGSNNSGVLVWTKNAAPEVKEEVKENNEA